MRKKVNVVFFMCMLGLSILAVNDAQAQQFLWSKELPNTRIDKGVLVDVDIPGVPNDIVVLGVSTYVNSTSASTTEVPYIVGLDSRSGVILYAKEINPPFGASFDYIVSVQAISDRNGDRVEDVLVRALQKTLYSGPRRRIFDFVYSGLTGDSILLPRGQEIETHNLFPTSQSFDFAPIIGDYDGDGKKDNFLIRKFNFHPNDGIGPDSSIISAIR